MFRTHTPRVPDLPVATGVALLSVLLLACPSELQVGPGDSSSNTEDVNDETPPELPSALDGALDTSGGALRVIEVPAASGRPDIVATPAGFLTVSQRFADGKALAGGETVLYRSRDGISWVRGAFGDNDDNLVPTGLAYGAGRYVVVGWRLSQSGSVTLVSDDGETWSESAHPSDYSARWGQVVFAGGRFFAFGAHQLGVSEDGKHWQRVPTGIIQVFGLSFGNGRYVLVGSGGIQSSADGLTWQSHPFDCAVPDACVTDPSGNQSSIIFDVAFAAGRFRAGPFESEDGIAWVPADGPALGEPVGGFYFRVTSALELEASSADAGPWSVDVVRPTKASVTEGGRQHSSIGVFERGAPLPARVEVPFEDGLTCATATCLVIGGHLYLVPPPGTPPLPDRVPRLATGQPLLTDECPASAMVTCDDYGARTGCVCNPEAPRRPRSCGHVGQFACAGRFLHQPGEWEAEEVGAGGCDCNHQDPDAPPSFGLPCDEDASACEPPMGCMEVIDTQSSCCGPPGPTPRICTTACTSDADCPSWQGTGFCEGPVTLRCGDGVCQQRTCE